jgi:sialidase-1
MRNLIFFISSLISFFLLLPKPDIAVEKRFQNKVIVSEIKIVQTPILKNLDINPALIIKLYNPTQARLTSIRSFTLSLKGSDRPNDIESIEILNLEQDSVPKNVQYQLIVKKTKPFKQNMTLNCMHSFSGSLSYILVSVRMSEKANLDHKIRVQCEKIEFTDNTFIKTLTIPGNKQRIGVAVRKHMDDNVHTYRIPGLATTKLGTLLAIYDVRRESSRDLQGDIDIGVIRSTDRGKTWEPMRIVMDMKKWGDLAEKFNGVSDACILVDKNSDRIFLAGLWMHGVINEQGVWQEGLTENSSIWNHQWRNKGSQPGLGVKQTSQFLITTSSDDGKTWSEPVNITKMCKKEEWWLFAPAPGQGITLGDGTLVFPTQGRDKNGETFSNITYSKDGGKTWTTSNPAYSNTTENMVVQIADGSIMLNARFNENRNNKGANNGRVVVTTNNLGLTWKEHPSSRSALIESVCMASIHKHIYHENGEEKSILLFSNPNTKTGRYNMTIKVSFDEGRTWPEKYWKLLDPGSSYGYSCLTSINEKTIGILYEGSRAHMTFESILLDELLNPGKIE